MSEDPKQNFHIPGLGAPVLLIYDVSLISWGARKKVFPQESKCSVGFSRDIIDMGIPLEVICNCYT